MKSEKGPKQKILIWGGAVCPARYSRVNRIQGKYMLENKKLSDRKILYQFLRRIPIQNRTIAYDIVNRDSNEKQD